VNVCTYVHIITTAHCGVNDSIYIYLYVHIITTAQVMYVDAFSECMYIQSLRLLLMLKYVHTFTQKSSCCSSSGMYIQSPLLSSHVCTYIHVRMYIHSCMYVCTYIMSACMYIQSLRLLLMLMYSHFYYFKLQVSFAKEPYKRDYILQKRPMILRRLLIVATP